MIGVREQSVENQCPVAGPLREVKIAKRTQETIVKSTI